MDYMTVIEAASKWNVTVRQVQRLIAANRISGVIKYGRAFVIPANAKKPGDPRFERLERGEPFKRKSLSQEIADFNAALSSLYIPLDNPDAVLDMTHDERIRLYLEMELAYPRGHFEKVKRLYQEIKSKGVEKLFATGPAIAASISLGDYAFFMEVETWLKSIIKANLGADVTAYAEFCLAIAYNGMVVFDMVPDWLKNGDFSALPDPEKPYAAYVRGEYLSQQKKPDIMLAVAHAYLSFCASEDALYSPDTYLRILCAEACWAMGRETEAKDYLRGAMKKNLPHGFISPFAERLHPLGGLCELMLKQEFPEYYDAVVSQCERATRNWLIFHNRFTKDNIAYMLPIREYHMARLVAQGVPFKKIAAQFNMTYGAFNNRMQEIYQKLFIKGKTELPRLIL